ncbi:hypothetical protein [Sneathiella aquimaris]|uniref:hypothetical protein n=1 Tax=Sneathiella aquimaris TaxID=2599305 RepID=UPI00146A7E73|nr:hypothetical protein [Sneathiella aquimaris]
MKNIFKRIPVYLAFFFIPLSACAQQPVPDSTGKPWQAITPTNLVLAENFDLAAMRPAKPRAPMPVNKALSSEENLVEALKIFNSIKKGDDKAGYSLTQLWNEVTTQNVPRTQNGIGGVPSYAFLSAAGKALLLTTDPGGPVKFNNSVRVRLSMSGQILNYKFDKMTGSGVLIAATYLTTTVTPVVTMTNPFSNSPKPEPVMGQASVEAEAFIWKVRVKPGGFTIVNKWRDDDPFPGTIPFTREMVARSNALGHNYKLWAKGKKIRIKDVWHAEMLNGNWNWERVDNSSSSTSPYKHLYTSSDDNCIDMLFQGYPPADLADMAPPLYCLGRCTNPLIVNTGM